MSDINISIHERFYKYDSDIVIIETQIIVISLRNFVLYFIFAFFECNVRNVQARHGMNLKYFKIIIIYKKSPLYIFDRLRCIYIQKQQINGCLRISSYRCIDKILYNNGNILFFCKYLEKIKTKSQLCAQKKVIQNHFFNNIFIKIDEISFLNNYRRIIILILDYEYVKNIILTIIIFLYFNFI